MIFNKGIQLVKKNIFDPNFKSILYYVIPKTLIFFKNILFVCVVIKISKIFQWIYTQEHDITCG